MSKGVLMHVKNMLLSNEFLPNRNRGGGGVMHRSLKNPLPHERSRKTPPIRPHSYQKGHLFIPKTAILSQPFKNPYDRLPVITMEPRAGVEPAANSLQGCRSTTELPRRNNMKDPNPHIFFLSAHKTRTHAPLRVLKKEPIKPRRGT